MKKYLLLLILCSSTTLFAQTPEDALRASWFTQNGSGRNTATGGVMGSLGGDITANHVNPAGLGLFKTNEFMLSAGMQFNSNKFNYRGTDASKSKQAFNYGASGLILSSSPNYKKKWTSSAFAISVNQVANYNNHVQFKGFNNYSSYSEKYLEELVRDRADTNAALSNYIFGSSLAFRTYLIDTTRGAGGAVTGYQSLVPISTGSNQSYDANTSGGYHEVAIGLAGNMDDKLYIGGSFVIPIMNYHRDLVYSEKDATTSANNDFSSFEYKESYTSRGVGIGMKLGMIYKPKEYWRIGIAFHTPQLINFKDEIRSSMITNTEKYAGIVSETSDALNSGNSGKGQYNLTTPLRTVVSASYVFREVKDTRKQRAFLSADIEYVNYKGARYHADDNSNQALVDYYTLVNDEIKDYYKNNFNVRIGGELKFNVWMVRLGGGYYGSPYADENLKADKIVASGGLGYRNHGFFIDLSYAQAFQNDVQFAYRLNDKANTYATQTGGKGTLMMTFGIKF